MENNIKNNSANVWKFVNNKRGSSRIPCRLHHDNNCFDDPHSAVDAFPDFFCSTFSTSHSTPSSCCLNSIVPFDFPIVCENENYGYTSK